MKIKELLEKYGYENVVLFEEPEDDFAFIGVSTDNRAVYDFDLMAAWLMKNYEMSEEEAYDAIYHSDSFSQCDHPLIVNVLHSDG